MMTLCEFASKLSQIPIKKLWEALCYEVFFIK